MQFGPTIFHNGAQLRQLERSHKIFGKALFSRSEGGPEFPPGAAKRPSQSSYNPT